MPHRRRVVSSPLCVGSSFTNSVASAFCVVLFSVLCVW